MVVAFSSDARIMGEGSTVHSPHSLFFFFFKEISLRAPLALSQAEDQSTVAQRSETTVDERSHDELRVNSFSP